MNTEKVFSIQCSVGAPVDFRARNVPRKTLALAMRDYCKSNRACVNPPKNVIRALLIRIQDSDSIGTKASSHNSALARPEVFEIQVTHDSCGVYNRHRNARVLGGRVDFGEAGARRAAKFHPANRGQADG